MAINISQWTLDDSVKFMEDMAKSHNGSMSALNIDCVVLNFQSNSVSGSDMLRFDDSEWKDLISYFGFRNHVKAGLEKIKLDNEKEA